MQKLNGLSRSLISLDPDGALICVIALSLRSRLTAGVAPGVAREPLKKFGIDESALLKLLHQWRAEAKKAGHPGPTARGHRRRWNHQQLAMCRGQRHEVGCGQGSHVEGDFAGKAGRKPARHQLGTLFLPARFVGDRVQGRLRQRPEEAVADADCESALNF